MKKNVKITVVIIVVIIVLAVLWISLRSSGVLFAPATQCNDRYDNDGDRRCDYGASGFFNCKDGSARGDTGCSSKSDNSEASCVAGSTSCGVGACLRSSTCVSDATSCTPGTATTEICGNGIDEDCNGADLTCPPPVNNTNSCADTDGGLVISTKGTVSGLINGTAYSYTDSCITSINITSTSVREYYCSTSLAFNQIRSCAGNLTGTCSDGACV